LAERCGDSVRRAVPRNSPNDHPFIMSTATAPISPPEEDLKTAIISLKERHPTLGITKYHTLLLSENPEWIVSEKRL
jgi:hypothetical protein